MKNKFLFFNLFLRRLDLFISQQTFSISSYKLDELRAERAITFLRKRANKVSPRGTKSMATIETIFPTANNNKLKNKQYIDYLLKNISLMVILMFQKLIKENYYLGIWKKILWLNFQFPPWL